MHQNNFTEITTERLVLRKLKETDWEMISYLRSDKEVNKFVKRPNAPSKEKALEFISKTNNAIDNNSILYWVITEKGKNEMIGSICLWNFSEDKKKAEVGYDLSPEFQRKGIMDESLKNILKFGFNTLLLDAIVAYTQYNNESSVKLLKRNNFKLVEDLKDEENEYNRIFEIKKEA
ncbi:GNAT family N-acetyltransferase [Tenacibaculum agarivorans]|uniref:GNAT family N-acetyltransferase n=1 Tax=Tenacibaculum agarivorans TaxID=1908389 RepID=UPI00094BB845|nr:GNAT family N-acetyltransferase [Tenacibaculum agarivorans]